MNKSDNSTPWSSNDIKTLTESYIDHVYNKYYKSYLHESEYYEKWNNVLFFAITSIGFMVTISLGLYELFSKYDLFQEYSVILKVFALVFPTVSSFLVVYSQKKGLKKKEDIRENARIECKHLVNEARMKFVKHQNNDEKLEKLYLWLNNEVKKLQSSQASEYFGIREDD